MLLVFKPPKVFFMPKSVHWISGAYNYVCIHTGAHSFTFCGNSLVSVSPALDENFSEYIDLLLDYYCSLAHID